MLLSPGWSFRLALDSSIAEGRGLHLSVCSSLRVLLRVHAGMSPQVRSSSLPSPCCTCLAPLQALFAKCIVAPVIPLVLVNGTVC